MNLPPQVDVFTHEFYPKIGGIGTYVEEVSRALSDLGVAVTVWAPAAPALAGQAYPFAVRALPVRGTQDWDCRLKLAWAVWSSRTALRDSVVYLPEPGPLRTWMYLQFLSSIAPRALVLTFHGSEVEHLCRAPHRRLALGRLLSGADRVSGVSRYVNQRLLQHFPQVSEKLVLGAGAVRSQLCMQTEATHCEAQPPARQGTPRQVVLTVGRVHPRKGQIAVIEALARLPGDLRQAVEYRIVGPVVRETYRRELEATAERHSVRVSFAGAVSEAELSCEFDAADVFALTSVPSRSSVEGFGLVYLEAGARGLPVVAHRIGGVDDAVADGETGLLVDPDDRAALATALWQLLSAPKRAAEMGRAGRRWAARFSWTATATALFQGL